MSATLKLNRDDIERLAALLPTDDSLRKNIEAQLKITLPADKISINSIDVSAITGLDKFVTEIQRCSVDGNTPFIIRREDYCDSTAVFSLQKKIADTTFGPIEKHDKDGWKATYLIIVAAAKQLKVAMPKGEKPK